MLARRTLKVVVIVSLLFMLVNLFTLQYGYQSSYLQIALTNNYFKHIQNSFNVSSSMGKEENWKGNAEDEAKQTIARNISGIQIAKNAPSENGAPITRHLYSLSSKEVSKINKTMEHVLNYGSLKNSQGRLQIDIQQLKSNLSDNPVRAVDNYATLKREQSTEKTNLKNAPNDLSSSMNRQSVLSSAKNEPKVLPSSSQNAIKIVPKIGTIRTSTCNECFAHNFKYIINNENICRKVTSNQTIDLIIMILTTHANFAARNALRETWLSCSNENTANIRYVFLLGEIKDKALHERVVEENKKYNDIIKEDFTDSYMNLTYKTVMGYKWIVSHCSVAKYVIKTDDDMFINIPSILRYIRTKGNTLDNNLAGSCGEGAPNRNIKSKWHASLSAYKESKYPGFCSGTAYVTSMKLATKIHDITSIIPFFHLEDVYIGLCLKKVGGNVINLRGFNRGRPTLDPCLYKGDNLYTSHLMNPTMLYSVWKGICKSSIKKQP